MKPDERIRGLGKEEFFDSKRYGLESQENQGFGVGWEREEIKLDFLEIYDILIK